MKVLKGHKIGGFDSAPQGGGVSPKRVARGAIPVPHEVGDKAEYLQNHAILLA
jgi:hypothetical protein